MATLARSRPPFRSPAVLAAVGWFLLVAGLAVVWLPLALIAGGLLLVLMGIGLAELEGRRR